MSRDWFDVALASKDNELKKTSEEEDVRETHLCL